MLLRDPHTIVIVPGLRGHVEEHWQTHLAHQHPDARIVCSFGRDKRDLDGRVEDLQEVVAAAGRPVTLVAHSAGCLVTLHWARRYGAAASVTGALLATPPDLAKPLPAEYPSLDELRASGWLPIPTDRLPFPSIVATSTNDPLGEPGRVAALAAYWGSEVVDVGPVGHLNPASGYGPWPEAEALIDQLHGASDARDAADLLSV